MKQSQSGFTLVELAIVLMIIGLLIGGILRGQELMENARVSSTIQQVNAYIGGTNTFLDGYGSLPGDLVTATSRVPGCTAANNCGNGNGNGIIGNPMNPASGVAAFNTALAAALTTENAYFWKHLAAAHIISGVNPSASVTPANHEWGASHPAAKTGGGFIVFYARGTGGNANDFGTGHVLRLQTSPGTETSVQGSMPISPIKARMIDEKMDDGMPDSGDVTADYEGTRCDNGGVYQNTEQKNCVMQFVMD